MKKEKILITGGAEFIGSNLANRLLCEGHEVVVAGMERVYHLAGQVAVTTSVVNPHKDFDYSDHPDGSPGTQPIDQPADRPVYISDIRRAERELGWQPKVSVRQGATRLFEWIRDHQELFQHL